MPAELPQILEALTGILQIVDRLGVSGLVLLALSGPALVVLAILVIEYNRSNRMREENAALVAAMREENAAARQEMAGQLEAYRQDTQKLLRDLGANQQATDQYYRDNVELVKSYELVSRNLQDVVISNTRVLSRLETLLEGAIKGGRFNG